MFAGLRSRWMMPCSCAASSASAICFAMGSASSTGIAPRAMHCERSSPSTNSITSAVIPPDFSMAWIAAMFGWFSEASVFASRSNLASRSASWANASGNTLIATWRPRLVSVARSTSPSAADEIDQLKDAEAGAGNEGQRVGDYSDTGVWERLVLQHGPVFSNPNLRSPGAALGMPLRFAAYLKRRLRQRIWCARRDLNPRPSGSKPAALSS